LRLRRCRFRGILRRTWFRLRRPSTATSAFPKWRRIRFMSSRNSETEISARCIFVKLRALLISGRPCSLPAGNSSFCGLSATTSSEKIIVRRRWCGTCGGYRYWGTRPSPKWWLCPTIWERRKHGASWPKTLKAVHYPFTCDNSGSLLPTISTLALKLSVWEVWCMLRRK